MFSFALSVPFVVQKLAQTNPIARGGALPRRTNPIGAASLPYKQSQFRTAGLVSGSPLCKTNPISETWPPGPRGQLYKQSQKTVAGRRLKDRWTNKANFAEVPACETKPIRRRGLSCETKPIFTEIGGSGVGGQRPGTRSPGSSPPRSCETKPISPRATGRVNAF